MLNFKSFLATEVINELIEDDYHFHLYEEMVNNFINSLNEDSSPVHLKVAGGHNPWGEMRKGAAEHFGGTPEQQQATHKENHKIFNSHKGSMGQHLLGDDRSNPKLTKSGHKLPDYSTKGLSLAAAHSSGREVCPNRTEACTGACIGTNSGRGVMSGTANARKRRTDFMFDHPKHFYARLDHEITHAKEKAHKNGQKLAVRLNMFSDVPHEHIAPQLFQKHHDVKFYDYTKVTGRTSHHALPKNYHLTTSSTGVTGPNNNWKSIRKHLDKGGVASMVFKARPGKAGSKKTGLGGRAEEGLPTHVHDEETGKKYRVINGAEHDHRHLDKEIHGIPEHEGVIAGLHLKTRGSSWSPKHIAHAGDFAVHVHDHVPGKTEAHGYAVAPHIKNTRPE